ncbi:MULTISPECIES: DUF2782 domain-containing protein [Thioalkalivibrio]|uniref:DUF2782 domain-containing protein n=2 Tax=Ectothiorhodospiraceae TaxID=72276 RepID=UPI00037C160E|nr:MULTISPECIES: DUF2782 domain-containing protein [Thioalkalivibrio]OOC50282.1 hypothetical protein B0684_03045 [Thioalkalivibrio versutus]
MMTPTRLSLPLSLLAALLLVPGSALAQEDREWGDAPPPPELDEAADPPPPVLDERAREQRSLEEADIIIIERDGETRREYRMGGQLVMVEVTPAVGPTYYLIDTTGDGTLDGRRNELDPDFVPPSWVIFRW